MHATGEEIEDPQRKKINLEKYPLSVSHVVNYVCSLMKYSVYRGQILICMN